MASSPESNAQPLDPNSPEAERAAANPRGWLRRNGPFLMTLVLIFLGIQFYFGTTWSTWLAIIIAALGLGLVIFIHELGHFLVAKWCDVHVETFSIGFGPPLPGCAFQWGETLYKIAVFPLGGYVKMVGEGAESDESDTDPRSFKNKPVWQRMAIISAGVTMNLILAFVCFVFVFRTHGDEQKTGRIGQVSAGSPLWQTGGRSGQVIYRLGNQSMPTFEELTKVVTNSTGGETLDIVLGPPGATQQELEHKQIVPRKGADDAKPYIGIVPAYQPRLPGNDEKGDMKHPYGLASAAGRAKPAFAFGDQIVGTTDPDAPDHITDLPPDRGNPNHRDYFEFHRRLRRLAGKPIVIQVERKKGERVNINVPAAFHYTLGARMRMGKLIAIRDQSPAAKAGLQPGDVIERIEIPDTKKELQPDGLDPMRLRYDLEQWAARAEGAKQLTLIVVRTNPPPSHDERTRIPLTVTWEDGWDDDIEIPLGTDASLAIPGLGMAYQVESTVEDVSLDSPAAKAGLKKGDVIKEILRYRFADANLNPWQEHQVEQAIAVQGLASPWGLSSFIPQTAVALRVAKSDAATLDLNQIVPVQKQRWLGFAAPKDVWTPVGASQWGAEFLALQLDSDFPSAAAPRIGLRVSRQRKADKGKPETAESADKPEIVEVIVDLQKDTTWATDQRGVALLADETIKKADSLGQALLMGLEKSSFYVDLIVGNIRGLVTGRLSAKSFGGPITIGWAAYLFASKSIYDFLIFMGIIGVNLAVVNFMPIPVLDGGHMVFLIYEKLRGKPAPERVRVAASLVGVTLILGLMAFVIYLDIHRLLS